MSEKSIWNKLREKGFSEKATAAIMGNMQGESGLIPYRLQGDFDWKTDYQRSRDYTAKVDCGKISKSDFLHEGPCGGGYGLCQWTFWSRKEGLYETAQKLGLSIGDEKVGIDWLYREIQKSEYVYKKNNYEKYPVFEYLSMDVSLLEMTKAVLHGYEKPYDQSDAVANQRAAWGQEIWDRNKGASPDVDPEPTPEPTPTPTPSGESCQITVPVLRKGSVGDVVYIMQCALKKKGYSLGIYGCDGDFGSATENAVRNFQRGSNLFVDGIVGESTWQVLFQ